MIKALILDVDGVLLHHAPEPDLLCGWERALGLAAGALQNGLWDNGLDDDALTGAVTAEEYWRRSAERLGVDALALLDLVRTTPSSAGVEPVLAEFVSKVRDRVATAVLTNAWSDRRPDLERHGIHGLVDLMVISAEEGLRKPDAAIYSLTVARLGVQPHEALFVDDREPNVRGAEEAGLTAFLYTTPDEVVARLAKLLYT